MPLARTYNNSYDEEPETNRREFVPETEPIKYLEPEPKPVAGFEETKTGT